MMDPAFVASFVDQDNGSTTQARAQIPCLILSAFSSYEMDLSSLSDSPTHEECWDIVIGAGDHSSIFLICNHHVS